MKVTTGEGWVKLEGEPEQIDKAQRVFDQLEEARQRGVPIQKHEFNYTLPRCLKNADETLGEVVSTKIVTSSRRPPIVARSANQRDYLEAIQKHDVVFGIGPAGTGKTYLAVAIAVAALKKEQVSRIVLTRPAVEAGEAWVFFRAIWNKRSPLISARFTTRYETCSIRRKWSERSLGKRSKSLRSHICAAALRTMPSSFSMKLKTAPPSKCSCC